MQFLLNLVSPSVYVATTSHEEVHFPHSQSVSPLFSEPGLPDEGDAARSPDDGPQSSVQTFLIMAWSCTPGEAFPGAGSMDWKYGKVSSQCLDSEMEWHLLELFAKEVLWFRELCGYKWI